MKKVIFTPFGQKRKTLYKRNVLGTFFRPESRYSNFCDQKAALCLFFSSGALLAPKTLQNGKVGPKVKIRFWAFWAPKTCPEPYVFHCFALGAKMMLFCLSPVFALFRFLGAKAVLCVQKWRIHPKSEWSALFRLFAKMAPKIAKKALSRATFLAHARFSRFGAKMRKSAFWGEKVLRNAIFAILAQKR